MGFNAEAYRREAKALGLSDAEIEQDIAEETAGQQETFAEPTKQDVDLNKDQAIPGWLQPALGVAGVGLAGAAAGAAGKSIYDRWIGKGKSSDGQGIKIEPQMDVNQRATQGRIEPTWEPQQAINQANGMQTKTAQQSVQEAIAKGEIVPGTGGTLKESEINMLGASEKAKVEKEIAKKGIKPPEQKTFATAEELSAKQPGTVFKPGLGPGDNWLYNTYGAEGRKSILNQFNDGKPAGSYEEAVALSKKAQQVTAGPQIPRDVAKARAIPPTETNYGKLGTVGKVAGAAGLLMTAASAANAAQREKSGEKGAANEFLFNLLSAIPGLGTAFNAGTFSGGLNTNEEAELARRRQMSPTISR